MGRLARWEKAQRYSPVLIHDEGFPEDDVVLLRYRATAARRERDEGEIIPLVRGCKEIVLEIRDGADVMHLVLVAVDPEAIEFVVGPALEISGFESDEEVKTMMAIAIASDVPVYPENAEAEARLAALHRDLLANGFWATEEGPRLKLTRPAGVK